MNNKYMPTGNEQISLPMINELNASIESINFLHMGYKGIVEIVGGGTDNALISPTLTINGTETKLRNVKWNREQYWIPSFTSSSSSSDYRLNGVILAPIGERGFAYRLEIINMSTSMMEVELGWQGTWKRTLHTINESKPMSGVKIAYKSRWNGSYVFEFRNTVTVFSFAPIFETEMDVESCDFVGDAIQYKFAKRFTLKPGEKQTIYSYWGVAFEEVGSTTSAKDMLRKGFSSLYQSTLNWLKARSLTSGDKELDKLFNTNLFFNFFYASGVTLDTEQFVLVTSRSPRYYVSAAYWDRDSLLWSFPSILIVDAEYARNMLDYVFTVQLRNVGVHSRYIDGTVLEPGFELDELCAPIIALYHYVKQTGKRDIIEEPHISKGIERILAILQTKKHPTTYLYETFLQPTDDMIVHPYLTYNNVLVYTILMYLSELLEGYRDKSYVKELVKTANLVKEAIYEHCVVEHEGKPIFAWSIDLKGNWNLYDEPPGSLQLIPFYGFCDANDPIYVNTVEQIRRPDYPYSFANRNIPYLGCEHAPHPWVLSIANSLITGRKDHFLKILPILKMDNGIACESVDENTGECKTGEAFATCAGFLAYAMYLSFFKKD